jgi:ubiquitin-conjugating enzyme E2 Z
LSFLTIASHHSPQQQNKKMSSTTNAAGAINRITKEIANIHKGTDLSLAVACRDNDVRQLRALIVGPPDTPYEFGFFELSVKFPKEYPIKSPTVISVTTNGGQTRFNPNIYAQGKVCLSILGTWPGEKGEGWSSAQGLESVLLSIQSLMSPNPWENEPGEEDGKITDAEPAAYARKVRHETLRIAVIERMEKILKIAPPKSATPPESAEGATAVIHKALELQLKSLGKNVNYASHDSEDGNDEDNEDDSPDTEASVHEYDAMATYNSLNPSPWDPFADLLKRRFLWYYDSYVLAIQKALPEQKDGTKFVLSRFEMPGNAMPGKYAYASLLTRLRGIRDALSNECTTWTALGAKQVEAESQLATQLAFQFRQLEHHYNNTSYSGSRLELSLPDSKNLFAWRLTLFGQSSTNLDGGVFNISFTVPPNFPDAWPRVYVETPIFHHRVSASTGALCYFPAKPDEIGSHLRAIVASIEDLEPKFDPRAVIHPEATKLRWGSEADKKVYFRKLRRSAQDSMEF